MAYNIVYAPVIAATLPAFTPYKLIIPFTHNPAVSKNEVAKFYIRFKDINTSAVVHEFTAGANNSRAQDFIEAGQIVYTDENELKKLSRNTSYKIQIAYAGVGQDQTTLRYSTAGIIRCVANPKTFQVCNGKHTTFSTAANHKAQGQTSERIFTGLYDTSSTAEVVYEYQFALKKGSKIIETTGWQLHNSLNDILRSTTQGNSVPYRKSCFDYFEPQTDLQGSEAAYVIEYSVKTINGLELSTKANVVFQKYTQDEPYTITIGQTAEAKENGYLDIQLGYSGVSSNTAFLAQSESLRTGDFMLRRTDSTSNYTKWDNILTFKLTAKTSWEYNLHWIDATIEAGTTYKYAINRLESNGTSIGTWKESNKFTPVLEHMYLADSEKQLCLKFNPQISSIKRITQESKLDTIGGKYPVFFKNGDISYTEIPISGLISYLMDEQEMFVERTVLGLNQVVGNNTINTPTINLTDYNIAAERHFKFLVLDWLNNGKPKYFRSAQEGNYIVRTLGASLSPNTQVGRMLHTVSCTGDEVADNTINNLIQHNVLYVKKVRGRVEL